MTTNDTFERRLDAWLEEDSARRVPDHLDLVLMRTIATRQRPGWSSLERWLPTMDTVAPSRVANLRPVLLLALLSALLATVVGIGLIGKGSPFETPALELADNGRVYIVDGMTLLSYAPDLTDRQVVQGLGAPASDLAVAPDGRSLAMLVRGIPNRLDVVPLGGGVTVTLPTVPGSDVFGSGPSWSPDSTKVAYLTWDGQREHLIVAGVDGSAPEEIGAEVIDPALGLSSPVWSPDGEWIAFVSADRESGTGSIQRIRPDGADLETVATDPVDAAQGISWSPDPSVQRLLYVRETDGLQTYLYDFGTGEETWVTDSFWPTWSSDGSMISVWGTKVAATSDVLAGATRWTPVTPTWIDGSCQDHPGFAAVAFCGPASWSPDGTRLIGPDMSGDFVLTVLADGSGSPLAVALQTNVSETTGPVTWQPIRP
jgi:Tol biopolymer transport system component